MPKFEATFVINAKPEAVWEILASPIYIPKLYPDFISTKVEPEGRTAVGQKRTSTARAGTKLIEIITEVTEFLPPRRMVLIGCKGGAFADFRQIVELTPQGSATRLDTSYNYTLSTDYFKGMSIPAVENAAKQNQVTYLNNLKMLSELKPIH